MAERRTTYTPAARTPGGRLYSQIAVLLFEFDELAPEDQEHVFSLLEQTVADLRARRPEVSGSR